MNYLEISSQINWDIDMGVYLYFTKLRERLEYISQKLTRMEYCKNTILTRGEKKTLRENEYIK